MSTGRKMRPVCTASVGTGSSAGSVGATGVTSVSAPVSGGTGPPGGDPGGRVTTASTGNGGDTGVSTGESADRPGIVLSAEVATATLRTDCAAARAGPLLASRASAKRERRERMEKKLDGKAGGQVRGQVRDGDEGAERADGAHALVGAALRGFKAGRCTHQVTVAERDDGGAAWRPSGRRHRARRRRRARRTW